MLTKIRQRLTFANVISVIALFVALGGTSIAAVTLKRNAVKNRHIAKNAVTSPKVANGGLLAEDFAQGQLPAGPQGLQGERGLQGEQGPGAVRLRYVAPRGSFDYANLGTVGPWTVLARCSTGFDDDLTMLEVSLRGPGSAEVAGSRFTHSDAGVTAAPHAETRTPLEGPTQPFGQAVLRASSTSVPVRDAVDVEVQSATEGASLTLNGVADHGNTNCRLHGTGVPAS
jgi:hypothetical protein